ncbi:unnamed protein product [Calypogeia fissa]
MTIVTGDRYLDLLSSFIEDNTGRLLDGALLLKLNPVGLQYVQARLEALEELEALRVGAPVDYLRAYVADLGDHRALEQLRRVLRLLSSVKVVAMVPAPSRDPTPITLLPFSRLRFLELRGCDLSTSAARGLLELRPILEKLVCFNSADALRHIFSERTKEVQGAPVWSRLADVSCYGNGMLLMDDSLQLLPAVEALDLSRNKFAKVANLQKCSKLKYLDAGYNNITTVSSLNKILHRVSKLVLRNNALVSTRGLHGIASLEALDLSYNLISNFREVELLGELPSLRLLWLEGNPLTFSTSYRREALSYFPEPTKLVLDGKQTSMWESYVARRIAARRLKQRSKYGAFIPAQTCESSDLSPQLSGSEQLDETANRAESSNGVGPSSASALLRTRKKNSRLASIIDVTGLKLSPGPLGSPREGSFNSPTSLDPASPLHSVVESKEEIEETVQDLIQRTEVLKRAGSSGWLKELNALLESESKGKSKEQSVAKKDNIQQSPWQRRRRRRSSRKGSFGEELASSEKSDKDEENEEPETSSARFTRESSARRMRKDALAMFESGYTGDDNYLKAADLSTSNSLDNLQGHLEDAHEPRPLSPRIPDQSNDSGGLKLHELAGKLKLTEELVTGKMHAVSSSSPPQFNQALLRRRQTMERELLLLPPEREISPFDDSDTSSGGTRYSHLSDSSDSPIHSPSKVWQPFRFDHGHKNKHSSGPGERSDSEDTFQVWSDNEAQDGDTIERDGPDVNNSSGVVHSEEGAEHSGKVVAPVVLSTEIKERSPEDLIPMLAPTEIRESAAESTIRAVHSADSLKPSGVGITVEVQSAPQASREEGKDAAFVSNSEHEAVSGPGASSSSSSFEEGNSKLLGNVGPGKENRGGYEERVNFRSMSQPKSKSSRRIIHLESLPGVPKSSDWAKPPRESYEYSSELHRAYSLGRLPGQVLEMSVSSSVPFSNPFNITRSSSADGDLEKRERSRSRSQEDPLASTSLQPGESHEAADSSLPFHRVHHVVGPFVGQCA